MLSFLTLGLLAALPLAQCNPSLMCETTYLTTPGATNTSHTYTYTIYKTTETASTKTVSATTTKKQTTTVTKSATATSITTFYKTSAKTTTTVPTTSGFTPFSSFPAVVETNGPGDKKLRRAASQTPTTYATYRNCSTTTYKKSTVYTPTHTLTSTETEKKTTTITKTKTKVSTSYSTVSTPTQTVYAACDNSDNYSTEWKGRTVNQYYNYAPMSPSEAVQGEQQSLWRAAQQSPQDCCNAAFAVGAYNAGVQSGYVPQAFVWSGPSGRYSEFCTFLGTISDFGPGSSGTFFWSGATSGPEILLGVATNADYTFEGHCDVDPNSACPYHS